LETLRDTNESKRKLEIMHGQVKDEVRELQKEQINEKRAHTAFKDELSRVKELLLGKDNRVKQLESEYNTLRDEN